MITEDCAGFDVGVENYACCASEDYVADINITTGKPMCVNISKCAVMRGLDSVKGINVVESPLSDHVGPENVYHASLGTYYVNNIRSFERAKLKVENESINLSLGEVVKWVHTYDGTESERVDVYESVGEAEDKGGLNAYIYCENSTACAIDPSIYVGRNVYECESHENQTYNLSGCSLLTEPKCVTENKTIIMDDGNLTFMERYWCGWDHREDEYAEDEFLGDPWCPEIFKVKENEDFELECFTDTRVCDEGMIGNLTYGCDKPFNDTGNVNDENPGYENWTMYDDGCAYYERKRDYDNYTYTKFCCLDLVVNNYEVYDDDISSYGGTVRIY